jgi:hypothetical protein
MDERAAASGPFVLPTATRQIAWDGQASSTLILLGAGHAAGLYSVSALLVVRITGGIGVAFRTVSWNAPGAPAQSAQSPAPISLATPGTLSTDPVQIFSDGSGPIVVDFSPAGVVPPTEIDVYGAATKVARN